MMYHCTPAELDAQKGKHFFEMMQDLHCLDIELEARQSGSK
jgi:hypothetical protein